MLLVYKLKDLFAYKKMFKLALEVISVGTLLSMERGGLGFAKKQYSGVVA